MAVFLTYRKINCSAFMLLMGQQEWYAAFKTCFVDTLSDLE